MRDAIFEFLKNAGRPVPADLILSELLHIRAPGAPGADRVLRGIIADDPRFTEKSGEWQARQDLPAGGLPAPAALFIEQCRDAAGIMRVRGSLRSRGIPCDFDLAGGLPEAQADPLAQAPAISAPGLLVVWSRPALRLWNRVLARHRSSGSEGPVLYLNALAARVLGPRWSRFDAPALASRLALPSPDTGDPARMAYFLLEVFQALLQQAPSDSQSSLPLLEQWIESARPKVDFRPFAFGPDYLRRLPKEPGVYLMRDCAGKVLYVGKAGNLKRRLRTYFGEGAAADPKTARIHERLHAIEVIPTPSEMEALLLEMRLIRELRPPVNLQTKVHEKAAAYQSDRNLILLVPVEGGERAEVYFLRRGSFTGQQTARLGREPASRLIRSIRTIYFTRGSRRRVREAWEKEIVARWLAANRDRINFIDVDDAGSLEAVRRRLAAYLADPDRLRVKVLHR